MNQTPRVLVPNGVCESVMRYFSAFSAFHAITRSHKGIRPREAPPKYRYESVLAEGWLWISKYGLAWDDTRAGAEDRDLNSRHRPAPRAQVGRVQALRPGTRVTTGRLVGTKVLVLCLSTHPHIAGGRGCKWEAETGIWWVFKFARDRLGLEDVDNSMWVPLPVIPIGGRRSMVEPSRSCHPH